MLRRRPGHSDPRHLPAYGICEAAHHLRLPENTLRYWFYGKTYRVGREERFSQPILTPPPDPDVPLLSFMNLIEAHVLSSLHREHGISFGKVRTAIESIHRIYRSQFPLADHTFETDGVDLFVTESDCDRLVRVPGGQLTMREIIKLYLTRIERDPRKMPVKLFPFLGEKPRTEEPRLIVIDARISFGRPVLHGTGIAVEILAERNRAGDSIDALAEDYGRPRDEIERAIRWELRKAAA
jgi:uncharacterized protein (DUF433 family)